MKDIDFVVYEMMMPRMRFSEQLKYLEKNKVNTVYNEILDKKDLDFEMLDEIFQEKSLLFAKTPVKPNSSPLFSTCPKFPKKLLNPDDAGIVLPNNKSLVNL